MYSCKVAVTSKSTVDLRALCLALKPEERTPPSHKSKMSILCSEHCVSIVVESNDLSGFRAAVNSLFRLLKAVEDAGSV